MDGRPGQGEAQAPARPVQADQTPGLVSEERKPFPKMAQGPAGEKYGEVAWASLRPTGGKLAQRVTGGAKTGTCQKEKKSPRRASS